MQYMPSQTHDQDLVDVDALNDAAPLPKGDKPAPAPKKVKGPSAFNPKANGAAPNILLWAFMALVSYLIMPYAAVPLEGLESFSQRVLMTGAAGVGLGGMLLWRANRSGNEAPYSNTHMFFFISLALSLGGWIPNSLAFTLIGPLLAGFGIGSFLAIIALGWCPPAKASTPNDPKPEGDSPTA